jgi:site-specific recombinase XerD
LFAIGLRVSSLLILTVSHLKQLLNEGSTQISLIKKGVQRFTYTLCSKGKELLNIYHKEFFLLMRDKEDNIFFFTTQVAFDKPIQ